MARHIAIVEDEAAIRHNYEAALRRYGYQVSGYSDRHSALTALQRRLPDLVIIDVGLGDDVEGGFELCRELRSLSRSLPIIFLTARDSDLDVISGLRLGADDYLTKDISLQHLIARVVALFRRVEALSGEASGEKVLERGPLQFSVERMEVSWKKTPVPLTVTEFWLIHSLIRHPGHVRTRQQLMDDANVLVDDQTITSHIKRIRRKFVKVDAEFDRLDTVYGAGYRWKPE
ncbi:MAG: proteobacterial dedicated sortase system response regulator [Xanthomonadales bacterium]|nr:proteobacterial dedicated sortase system response regulator [Gammaproteobacteria bacterium]MBT8054090.1 proteobacterial dedicated sortase system response regulator [Gammaproteobacteria bacterium]NND55720.1 proteobacterial dedicated sortase system response regulator [Xanthomonadales bacterium]NNK51413.1 proteobacterial dedicated sortase system response regulator [Xanthomonadales bacterium]